MPGVARLEAELGVNHTTVGQALGLLEDEGFLVSTGDRRRRRIVLPGKAASPAMRIAFLTYEPASNDEPIREDGNHNRSAAEMGEQTA